AAVCAVLKTQKATLRLLHLFPESCLPFMLQLWLGLADRRRELRSQWSNDCAKHRIQVHAQVALRLAVYQPPCM
ncbi:hypothetical protein, partial [Sphingomonas sp. CARO-RG-8B-R24-01]|uniref:hypothetical protein n=1 Tax=Sphingomonas sp. CARO-RG-8B-R24-01 TaxID=2914831 RepID=UPI001F58D7D6